MIDRNQRCSLPARRHVGGAEIIDDRNGGRPGKGRTVAQLHREPRLGPVQHGLAVEADEADLRWLQAILGAECLNGLGMPAREGGFGVGEATGALGAPGHGLGIGDGAAQQPALGIIIGIGARGAALDAGLAVGAQQGDVDSVEGGSRHQSQSVQRF